MRDARLHAYDVFLQKPMPAWGGDLYGDGLRRLHLLHQAHRQAGRRVGGRAGGYPEDLRPAGRPRGGAQVPRRRGRPVRIRDGLPLHPGGPRQEGRDLPGHRVGPAGAPRALPQVLRLPGSARGQQVRRPQHGVLVRRELHLRAQGREAGHPAPGLLPHQLGEHGPVRADHHHRRRGRRPALHRGLYGAAVLHALAPHGRHRDLRPQGREGPLHHHPELGPQHLQPRHAARHRLRGRHHGMGGRQHGLAASP